MAETPTPSQPSSSPEANLQYKTGVDLKTKGQTDAALTWFRRAALSDPAFFSAHLEIGYLCREKAKRDKMFLRYAFEAFRTAARLDLTHEAAHNQYIMAGQQMGLIDSLHEEYNAWAKQFPDNELLQECAKNIVALSMAMIPQQTNLGATSGATSLRRVIFIASLLALLSGFCVMLAPPFLLKAGKIKKEHVASWVKMGLAIEAAGVAGFIARANID